MSRRPDVREGDAHTAGRSPDGPRSPLPPEIEALVAAVLHAAGLDFTEGRAAVERELRAHFEDGLAAGTTAEELVARFGDPAEAGRRIRETRPRAEARSRGERGRWWMSLGTWTTEVRRAAGRLGRAPAFTGIVVLTLALGVGVNTAIFSVLNAVLLQDLPYAEPDRLVRLYESVEDWGDLEYLRAPMITEWRGWDEVFDELSAVYTYREVGADLTDGEVPERINVLMASAGYFATLGLRRIAGRGVEEPESWGAGESENNDDAAAPVAVLSHRLWQTRYAGDPEIVGRTIVLDGRSYEVVGVMPASFRDPVGTQADVWLPQDMRPGGGNSWSNFYLTGLARLRDGVSLEAAQERLDALSAGLAEAQPETDGARVVLRPLQADLVGQTRRTMLWILAAAAALVLLTACVNVANLLFARGLSQDRALALRSALGSGRARLVAGILLENGILALMGGAVGLVFGWIGLRALLGVAPEALPAVTEVRFGLPVFLFALSVTFGALLVFGLTPAMRMSRTAPADVLRSGDRASTVGRLARRLRDGLVVVQVAAALVLVTGAILLTRSFDSLLDVPLAVDEDGVFTFEVHTPTSRYAEPADRVAFHRSFQERLRAIPGVTSVGAVSWLPVNGPYHSWGTYWDPAVPDGSNDDAWYGTDVRIVEGDWFEAMGVDLLRGESPREVDPEGETVAWLNRTAVADIMGDVDPIGQMVRIGGRPARVVGVVEDVPVSSRGDLRRKAYLPHAHADGRNWALIQTVKTEGSFESLQQAVRAELAALDPGLVVYRARPFTAILDTVRAQDRFGTILMAAFGLLALALSLIGTYGVLSGTVAARTREIGIRMALGADAGAVRSMVLRYAAALTVPGVLLGIALAWGASRWIESLLFGVEAGDPAAYAGAVLVFVAVGFVAGWLPARRATAVDTVEVLTAE